jgi:hypothetical protein
MQSHVSSRKSDRLSENRTLAKPLDSKPNVNSQSNTKAKAKANPQKTRKEVEEFQVKVRALILLLVISSSAVFCAARARADSSNTPGQYHVQSLDPDLDVSSLAAPGVVVHQAKAPKQDAKDLLPSTAARDKAFKKVGLVDELVQWDQLDRDHLYLRAQNLSEEKVFEFYPALPKTKLSALVQLIKSNPSEETVSK